MYKANKYNNQLCQPIFLIEKYFQVFGYVYIMLVKKKNVKITVQDMKSI